MRALSDRWSGDGQCGFCLQAYVVELEAWCPACDRPVCPLCATRSREGAAILCPDCASGALTGEDS